MDVSSHLLPVVGWGQHWSVPTEVGGRHFPSSVAWITVAEPGMGLPLGAADWAELLSSRSGFYSPSFLLQEQGGEIGNLARFSAWELEEETQRTGFREAMVPAVRGCCQAVITNVRESVTGCCCCFSPTSCSGPGSAHIIPQAQHGRAATGRMFRGSAWRRHAVPATEHITASPGVD